jgi:uncharacterized Rmd1/YagE family protein
MRSQKICHAIPLERLASFFGSGMPSAWRDYIVLQPSQLETVLKKPSPDRMVFVFSFGCLVFIRLDEEEILTFLNFMSGMVEAVNYGTAVQFSESFTIHTDEAGRFLPVPEDPRSFQWEETTAQVIAIILAKSSALGKIESDVGQNVDESGAYIDYLYHGRLRMNKKGLTVMISKFLKFELESIQAVHIFDRSAAGDKLEARGLYDLMAEHYELNDRFLALQSKTGSLRAAMRAYNSLSFRRNENRLYWFEVFLLGLFPVVGILRLFFSF